VRRREALPCYLRGWQSGPGLLARIPWSPTGRAGLRGALPAPACCPRCLRSPRDIAFMYSGYAPISIRLVQSALEGGW